MATKSTNAELRRAMKQLQYKMSLMDDTISLTSKAITTEIADLLVNEIVTRYGEFINSLEHDHQKRNGTIIYAEPSGEGYIIVVEGPQVIYDEFGTGTEGASNPHPARGNYNLEPYNSGFYIKTSKDGKKYWIYYSDDIDRYVTSHGVPAGCFIYNSLNDVAYNLSSNILFEKGVEMTKNIAEGKLPSDDFEKSLHDSIFG